MPTQLGVLDRFRGRIYCLKYIKTINVKNSKVGLAVKDSSKAFVDLLSSDNNDLCFSIYRKKKEFWGGELLLKNMNCGDDYYKVELGSKFYLEK